MSNENQPSDRLRATRIEAGYKSASAFATANGFAVPTYLSHENGTRQLSVANCEKYASVFSVSPVWLMYGDEHAAVFAMAEEAPEAEYEIASARLFGTSVRVLCSSDIPPEKARSVLRALAEL